MSCILQLKFGETLPSSSTYGSALCTLGRAECKIAALADQATEEISESYIAGLGVSASSTRRLPD